MIKESEYKRRRDTLAEKLSNSSVAVLFSSDYKTRSNDTEYPYRQNSNFYYLSGFKEDNSVLVLLKNKKAYESILFVKKKDKLEELWNGKRVGVKQAKKSFMHDKVYSIERFEEKLKEIISDRKSLYYDFKSDSHLFETLKKYSKNISEHKDISKDIEMMRIIKSDAEIELIKKAVAITKSAHLRAMKFDKKGKYEYQLQAEIEHSFKSNGAYSDAYTSIVAGGNNANTLHYISNNEKLKDGELILIDAGCEYEYYASDITRSIPVNKKFSDAQKKVYNFVLDAQKEVLDAIRPGVKRSELQKIAVESLTKALLELGVLKGDLKKLIKKEKYKPYYPHGIGHWMGIDVHDQCPYKDKKSKEISLREGMVLTIEPGLYLDAFDENVPEIYRGIGIRIEDDILITKDAYENLSKDIPKSIEDIENIR
jgi:Xaa-Pro aminopeptidase